MPALADTRHSVADVTAVVVHYRGGDHLRRCVESCLAEAGIHELIVVDNEGVGERLEREWGDRATIVRMPRNVGFGAAANAGLSRAKGAAALVLNQDVVVAAGVVGRLLDAGERTGAWIVAPALHDVDGRERWLKAGLTWPLPWAPPAAPAEAGQYVPYAVGAAMLFMPGHLDLRFDERFFMYAEDEDICCQVWASGGSVVAVDDARVLHIGGTATATRWSPKAIEYRIQLSRARLVRKHAGWLGVLRFLGRSTSTVVRSKLRYPA